MGLSRPHLRYKHQTRRERTWTIHLIALEKTVKGTLLIVVALRLLSLFDEDVHAWAEGFVTRHGVDVANKYVAAGLERLVGMGNTQLVELSVVALVYAAILFVEGIGLWMQKRWAEYLTVISTAIFIPFEIYEIYTRPTWVRIAILAVNIFVVWYLATRLKDEKNEMIGEPFRPKTPRMKICGITNLEDALAAVELGADDLGFNFYEKSPRYITPERAREMIDALPDGVHKVGVFVNESQERILEIVEIAGLDAIQLHGDEGYDFVTRLHRSTDKEVIKAIRPRTYSDLCDAIDFDAHAILLDSFSPQNYGGSGKRSDWKLAKELWTMVPCIYLAGGLSADNVAEAIREVAPFGVDACSRLESSPGKKDRDKVAAFIKAVKEAL
jgi:phosphoribosylanthranilate isomerase